MRSKRKRISPSESTPSLVPIAFACQSRLFGRYKTVLRQNARPMRCELLYSRSPANADGLLAINLSRFPVDHRRSAALFP